MAVPPALLAILDEFDRVFGIGIAEDHDAQHAARIVEWAKQQGLEARISAEAQALAQAAGVSDRDIETLVAEHVAARKARDFQKSDAIRNHLAGQGIILENMKDGTVRWRRK